ncbi:MAG: DUF3536 domain-containing protein [Acidimicrobiia bacterium]
MTTRNVCIHAHCYQPPREDPWLDTVAHESSAAPAHDWNERIANECYRPMRAARLLDGDGHIQALNNNYEDLSFNVGPTLHRWLEQNTPDIDEAVRHAEMTSFEATGHGRALAQPWVHVILPLADPRDRATLLRWGVDDFVARFGHQPEGAWLPETAGDIATLEALVDVGITATILAPQQAARVRAIDNSASSDGQHAGDTGNDRPWHDVDESTLDVSLPYRVPLPSGRSIDVVFFDGPVSRAIAFEGLLESGDRLADRVLAAVPTDDDRRILMIATDGETFGHHHRYGEMALAWTFRRLNETPDVVVRGLVEFIRAAPPQNEAQIHSPSSWSCAHGVERWRSNCGCSTGGRHGWQQHWRAPLRKALDDLRDRIAGLFERECQRLLKDPWAARDDYGRVLAGVESLDDLISRHAAAELSEIDRRCAFDLLRAQFHLMLAFSSCGWFFSDAAGIETIINLRQAARAIELTERWTAESLEDDFVRSLTPMRSNERREGDGAAIWARHVVPARIAGGLAVSLRRNPAGEIAHERLAEAERRGYRMPDLGLTDLMESACQEVAEAALNDHSELPALLALARWLPDESTPAFWAAQNAVVAARDAGATQDETLIALADLLGVAI